MEMKDFLKGLGIGLAAGATLGILFAPKSGKETRQEIADFSRDMKDRVAEAASRAGELTRRKYDEIVDSVVDAFGGLNKISREETAGAKEDMKRHYRRIREAMEDES